MSALPIPLNGDWKHRYQLLTPDGAAETIPADSIRSILLRHQATGAAVTLTVGAGLVSTAVAGAIDVLVDRANKAAWPPGLTTAEILLAHADGYEESVAIDLLDVHRAGLSTGAGSSEIRRSADTTRIVRVASGPPGPAGDSYVHIQASASAEWIVNHNLGAWPVVEIRSVGGAVIDAEVRHLSTSQFRVYFASPMTGQARCL